VRENDKVRKAERVVSSLAFHGSLLLHNIAMETAAHGSAKVCPETEKSSTG